MDEDDLQFTWKQFNSIFIIYEISPGVYSLKDISEAVYTKSNHEMILQIEYVDITMKTKLILTRFGLTFGVLESDGKLFFITLLGSTACWKCKTH